MVERDLTAVSSIFKAYDVRGTVPDQLDAELVERIGAAFAVFVAADPDTHGTVLVAATCGRRVSSWSPPSPEG